MLIPFTFIGKIKKRILSIFNIKCGIDVNILRKEGCILNNSEKENSDVRQKEKEGTR
jgi:hypothetical protein